MNPDLFFLECVSAFNNLHRLPATEFPVRPVQVVWTRRCSCDNSSALNFLLGNPRDVEARNLKLKPPSL